MPLIPIDRIRIHFAQLRQGRRCLLLPGRLLGGGIAIRPCRSAAARAAGLCAKRSPLFTSSYTDWRNRPIGRLQVFLSRRYPGNGARRIGHPELVVQFAKGQQAGVGGDPTICNMRASQSGLAGNASHTLGDHR